MKSKVELCAFLERLRIPIAVGDVRIARSIMLWLVSSLARTSRYPQKSQGASKAITAVHRLGVIACGSMIKAWKLEEAVLR